ncbi:hypothetical protein [Flavobacterium macacae]|uniref:hypothetical protein n=1 Tax=Flavobacterium macacae TaxID=2488993 RepID=UPI0011CF1AD7|nr:hypothetical protein [Flavobacterium macacae]
MITIKLETQRDTSNDLFDIGSFFVIFWCISHNVFQLGEVAEIETQNFNSTQILNRRTTVEFSTRPAILPN